MVELLHIDCMEYMKGLKDKAFDLAIVDPPYGIGADKQKESVSPRDGIGNRRRLAWDGDWDSSIPSPEYFNELFRVSKNQIIWGGNYFIQYLTNTRCILIWDKMQEFSGADFELAWTSFGHSSKTFRYARCLVSHYGSGDDKIHPTQKPVKLYRWLLTNYAQSGQRILDTHLGSGSSAIAAHQMGFDFVGCEIDKDYYDGACKRFKEQTMQQSLFQ